MAAIFFYGGNLTMKRANGEGSIYKRKDGRWCASYYDESPNPKRHTIYGKTQAEVRKKLKERQLNPEEDFIEKNDYNLENWVLFYLETYKRNEVKETTFDSYMGIYRKHILNSSIGKIQLKKITSNDLQEYYNEKVAEGYNPKTVRHIKILLNCALKKAQQLKYILQNANVAVVLPKCQKYHAKVLDSKEAARIFKEAKDDPLYPIIALTICTGLRKGEVMALKWSNVNFAEKEIYINGNLCRITERKGSGEKADITEKQRYVQKILTPKNESSNRVVPLSDLAVQALKIQKINQQKIKNEYGTIFIDRGFVFTEHDGNSLRQREFTDDYHMFLEKYNLSKVRFHDLRHTFATLLLEAGESAKVIQELLGHSSITTTMDTYAHITKRSKEKSVQTLNNIFEAKD